MSYEFDNLKDIDRIRDEIKTLQKFNLDPRAERGKVANAVNQYHPNGIKVKVAEIHKETPSCRVFRLRSLEGLLPPFIAGQYVNLRLTIGGVQTSRAYSIASSPQQRAHYEIAVREKPDGFVTRYLLQALQRGEHLEISAPAGQFYYNPLIHGKALVFIAGGSGITPFMSMIQDFYETGPDDLKVDLIYGCASEDDVIYRSQLQSLDEKFDGFSFHLVVSDPSESFQGLTGFITRDLLRRLLGGFEGKKFYLCGPEVMYQFVIGELEAEGVARRSVKREVQTPPDDPTKLPGWPDGVEKDQAFDIQIQGGRTIIGKASEPLLNTLERYSIPVPPAECRAGECSLCRAKLIEGEVYVPESVLLRKSDRAFGYVHLCAAYPVSDMTIRLDI